MHAQPDPHPTGSRSDAQQLLRIERPRLLVVEDDAAMWKLIERAAREGDSELRVHWAPDAEGARSEMESFEFDAVIADFMLEDSSSGWSILKLARRLQPRARLAMASALPLRPPDVEGIDADVPFLRKPFRFEECRDFVARLLR